MLELKMSDLDDALIHAGYEFLNPSSDELQHYGVIGMKWGIRRAKKKGVTYAYKSHGQKRLEKSVAKLKAKGAKQKKIAKYENELAAHKLRDKRLQSYAEKTSAGKVFLQSLLTGGNAYGYGRNRAAGMGRVRSLIDASASRYDPQDYGWELRRARKTIKKQNKKSSK